MELHHNLRDQPRFKYLGASIIRGTGARNERVRDVTSLIYTLGGELVWKSYHSAGVYSDRLKNVDKEKGTLSVLYEDLQKKPDKVSRSR